MVKHSLSIKIMLFFSIFLLFLPLAIKEAVAASDTKQNVYDFAALLSKKEIAELEAMANKYGEKRETDFVILTTNDTEGKNVEDYMADFYDKESLGYDKPHGNTTILTIDMEHRDVYMAGFYKAEKYLDKDRIDLILDKLMSDISDENYYDAFETYIKTAYKYMGIKPGISPDNILLQWWFHIIAPLVVAALIVGTMVYNSGGKVTINARTYRDEKRSKVNRRKDVYVRTSVTKRRKPSNNNNNKSGGGGGGVTRGGHSYSGSKRSF